MRKPIALFSLAISMLTTPVLAQTAPRAPMPQHTHNNLAFRREPLLSTQKTMPQVPLTQLEQAAQVLNRFTFGPTPGMAQVAAAGGLQVWFAQQLHPETIADTALEKRLEVYPSFTMTPAELAMQFPEGKRFAGSLKVREFCLPIPSLPVCTR